jgi:hypothetical protein
MKLPLYDREVKFQYSFEIILNASTSFSNSLILLLFQYSFEIILGFGVWVMTQTLGDVVSIFL